MRESDPNGKRPNDRVEGPPLAAVPSHDGLGVAVPPAPTFGEPT